MLKRILNQRDAKALLVLPYVALVQEKVRWLRQLVEGLVLPPPPEKDAHAPFYTRPSPDGLRVVGFFGGGKVRADWDDFDIGVCTLEKANMLVNTAIEDCSISKLHAVVLDELHMIDDEHRGYTLELIGTKLLSLEHSVQIVGMSATIPVSTTSVGCYSLLTFYRIWISWQSGLMHIPSRHGIVLFQLRSTLSATDAFLQPMTRVHFPITPTSSKTPFCPLLEELVHPHTKNYRIPF